MRICFVSKMRTVTHKWRIKGDVRICQSIFIEYELVQTSWFYLDRPRDTNEHAQLIQTANDKEEHPHPLHQECIEPDLSLCNSIWNFKYRSYCWYGCTIETKFGYTLTHDNRKLIITNFHFDLKRKHQR